MNTMAQIVLKYRSRKIGVVNYWHVTLTVYTLTLKFKQTPALCITLVIDGTRLVVICTQ